MDDPLKVTDRHLRPIDLQNSCPNVAAFLVGGGPSLNDLPTHLLRDRGVMALGVNNAAAAVPCSHFACSDPPFKFHHGLWFDPKVTCFIPTQKLKRKTTINVKLPDGRFAKTKIKLQDCPSVYGFRRQSRFDPDTFLTCEVAQWGNNDAGARETGRPKGMCTMLLGLRLLHYLGVRRVYLIGVDFSMPTESGKQYAFAQKQDAADNNKKYVVWNAMLHELRPIFDAAGFHVFNCLKRSGCTAFDHVPFDRALEDCRNGVPTEPLDLSGWYEKKVDVEVDDLSQCA